MTRSWWGEFDFQDGETRFWRLGAYGLWVTRARAEFRVASRMDQEPETAWAGGEPGAEAPPPDAEQTRYGVRESTRRLLVQPATADRPMVVKSRDPYIVPPDGAVTAFVSTPVWVRIHLEGPRRLLHEEPVHRPSDTWFGPDTMQGEMCYAVQTSVRYDLANVPPLPGRAVTVVRIRNRADAPLPLARLRLPLPGLSLFADADARLWTESVTLERREDDELAEITLGKAAPREAGACTKVAGPREDLKSHPIMRSFAGWLGLGRGGGGDERSLV